MAPQPAVVALLGSAGAVGFDHRHRNELEEEELIASLAREYRLEDREVRALLAQARRESAYDEYRHSVQAWFATLARRRADREEPVPGKRTAIQVALERRRRRPNEELAPGRRTLTDAEARRRDQYRAWKATEAQRLDDDVAQRMGGAFGFDFRGVVIRPDSPEARGTTKAVTRDGEIHFREGAYRPGTSDGDRLIAHELAHVVQQQGGRGERVGSRREVEREADVAASLVARGQAAPIRLRAPAGAYAFDEGEDHEHEAEAAGDAVEPVAVKGNPESVEDGPDPEPDGGERSDDDAGVELEGDAAKADDSEGDAGEGDAGGGSDVDESAEPDGGDDGVNDGADDGADAEAGAPAAELEDEVDGDDDATSDDEHDEAGGAEAPVTAEADGAGDADGDEAGSDDDDGPEVDARAELAAASAPVGAEDVGAGGGGGGGGGGAAAKPVKEAPNVAGGKPEAGVAQLKGVRPDKVAPALGQVHTAAGSDTDQARARAKASPPKQLSTAGPAAKGAGKLGAKAAAPAGPGGAPKQHDDKAVKAEVPGGQEAKQAQQGEAKQEQKSAGQVIDTVVQSIASWFGSFTGGKAAEGDAGKMSDAEGQQMAGSLDNTSTDASGISTDPGPAPDLEMKGEARAGADKDRAELEAKTTQLEGQGRADSRVPLGEDSIETTVPTEELSAKTIEGGAAPGEAALPSVAGAGASEEVGIIAQEEHGAEIDAALSKASADMAVERGKHAQEDAKARTDADKQVADLKTQADADQAAARTAAKGEVEKARGEWKGEIDKKGADARKQADKKVSEGMTEVEAEQTRANDEAKKHVDEAKDKAETEKQKGEKEAAEAKDKGKKKSSGFFGWLSSKAKAFFDGIKKAISSAIDAAKKAVKAVIDAAKKLAMAAIELARKAIVAVIKAIGKALIAISDVLLAAFPELKAKFQKAINGMVDKAVKAVNKLAEGLKKAVQKALDALQSAINKALDLLEKGLHFIVDAANAVVQAAIKAAEAIANALGQWLALIKDVAKGPGSWIGKLGAAVIDGIRNHLWSAFKTAVVEWFKSKVMELLGVGGILLQILLEGGINTDDIVKMALDALIVAIPIALVAILIEKLVSMIVPAAGAVLAIIEGLQAAWGTVSRIIAAFGAFMAFLQAVHGGGAGPLFATALAAAAIVLLDFVSNWLLKKLAGPAKKVGARLKGMGDKIKRSSRARAARASPRPTPSRHGRRTPMAPTARTPRASRARRARSRRTSRRIPRGRRIRRRRIRSSAIAPPPSARNGRRARRLAKGERRHQPPGAPAR
jgi:hypothetical protein